MGYAPATKLALVTKVGGGNGLCLDPIKPKRNYQGKVGKLYLTISDKHPDYAKVKSGTYMDLVHSKYLSKGYRFAHFVEPHCPKPKQEINVGDSVEGIWQSAEKAVYQLLKGEDILLDLSDLRPEVRLLKVVAAIPLAPSSLCC
ncbi:MAG: hypothetical protein R2865_04040 [Deinococcales bacterium]